MNIIENIRKRRSTRTFCRDSFTSETKDQIENYLKENHEVKGPLGHRIKLFSVSQLDKKPLGTYGIIKNPVQYIGGCCENSEIALLDFGYVFEKMVLDLNAINIGTCWMAGTFKRKDIAEISNMATNEIMPAITPIGYIEAKRTFENIMRKYIKADNRQPFSELFHLNDFKTSLPLDHKHAEAFESVQLGPSASNKQPWRLVYDEKNDTTHFYVDFLPKYNSTLGFSVQMIDMGIAMYHYEVSLKAKDIEGEWVIENPNLELPSQQYRYTISFQVKSA